MDSQHTQPSRFDAVIVGAGFAGLYQLHRLRQQGLRAIVIEAGSGVGGTWYWNRYPGARCDVESFDYSYSFDEMLQQEWKWSERFASQPEILSYINHVADRYDLRRDIVLDTKVTAARYSDADKLWTVDTNAGKAYQAKYVIFATGCLSKPLSPEFEGFSQFKGLKLFSAYWPEVEPQLEGMRVGIIGTGSSSVQMIPILAEQAKHLVVFQRTANFSVPAHNKPVDEEMDREVKASYGERRARGAQAITGHYLSPHDKSALEADEEERRRQFEGRWNSGDGGGFRFLRAFSDLLLDERANEHAADFCRSKIREIVADPTTAELLSPKPSLPFGTKRLCIDTDYYATFNRANVDLVDVKASPIVRFTADGLQTTSETYKLDAVVMATGFDAMTGALLAIDIVGLNGVKLRDKWQEGPKTYLGVAISDFPNMFTITGPGSPSVLSNMVHSIETHVDWITKLIGFMAERRLDAVAPKAEAQEKWVEHVNELANQTLYPKGNSWYLGANVSGKVRVFMPYIGGVPKYREKLEQVASHDYDGFTFS